MQERRAPFEFHFIEDALTDFSVPSHNTPNTPNTPNIPYTPNTPNTPKISQIPLTTILAQTIHDTETLPSRAYAASLAPKNVPTEGYGTVVFKLL